MPKLSVWLVRASLVYMEIGFFFGSLLLHHKGIPIYAWTWQLLGPHIEIMVFGWTIQFVMGIAYWITPRFAGVERYGKSYLGWLTFALLNSGVALTAVGRWFDFGWLMLGGRFCTLGAVCLFVFLMWPRVKSFGAYTASHSS